MLEGPAILVTFSATDATGNGPITDMTLSLELDKTDPAFTSTADAGDGTYMAGESITFFRTKTHSYSNSRIELLYKKLGLCFRQVTVIFRQVTVIDREQRKRTAIPRWIHGIGGMKKARVQGVERVDAQQGESDQDLVLEDLQCRHHPPLSIGRHGKPHQSTHTHRVCSQRQSLDHSSGRTRPRALKDPW